MARRSRARSKPSAAPEVVARQATIGPGGPPVGVIAATPSTRRQRETHPIIGTDANRLHSILIQAFGGRMGPLQDLYDDMRDRDSRVDAVSRTRTMALQARPWGVRAPQHLEEDTAAKKVAQRVQLILSRIRAGDGLTGRGGGGWATCVGQIADAILRGYSVIEIEWGVSREGWKVPVKLHWRHPNRFIFAEDISIRKYDMGDPYDGIPLSELGGSDKFIVHSPAAGRAAYPMRRGVMLGMIFPSLSKRYGMKWWLQAAERWGSPVPIAKLPSGATEQHVQAAQETLNEIHAAWSAVAWDQHQIELLSPGGNVGDVHDRLVTVANTEIAVQGLGQNLTTEVQGGSFAATTAHNFVRQDLLAGDAVELDDAITWQIIEPIVRYNWPGDPVPEYETQLADKATKEIFGYHLQAGVITKDEVRDSLGLPPLPAEMGGGELVTMGQDDGSGGADAADPFALSQPSQKPAKTRPSRTTSAATSSVTTLRAANESARERYKLLAASARSR